MGANFRASTLAGHGARHRCHRIRGQPPAAPPRGGGAARARAGPAAAISCRAWTPCRGDLLTGAGLEEALEGCSTAYYLVHSMEPAAERRLRGARQAHGRDLRRGGGARRGGADRLPRRDRAGRAARCRRTFDSRLEVEESLLAAVPGLDRAARLDRDRRRLVLVPAAGPARGAAARAADAALAQEPHPADRRARRDRVPRPHAAGARGGGTLARRGRSGRDDLRPHDRADRRRNGGRAPAAGARPRRSRRPPARSWPP